ncbi:N-ethylmaleimide reductase [Nannocystis exedens]|uniref:N-ethylmaleimide reductase n=1 Tax=Nannocystis exedens TaxID=54 RepID=A0A1I2I842_9BACT|nr:alkene reductase [Nannocystis exedens]PCC74924.1 alkene reductase [Nannocystis exedens]SFF36711.1 N-ethylmaleimide reductase [Nannocystis exedens]
MDLFARYRLGPLDLANRIVMAPMTRSRAIGALANELMRTYYAQRASAGLIITEGIAPVADGLGYARIPGLFTPAQVDAWRPVTDAVHARGGKILAQLMHVGRIAHPLNLPPGARILAPSAVAAAGVLWTDEQGPQPFPAPAAMTLGDLDEARRGFARAARDALAAGFDGVELHGANGYLLEQFLHPHTNRRGDDYGGGAAARARFVVEVAREAADAVGADRVGVRLSPYNAFNDMPAHDGVHEQYDLLADRLRGLLYLHLVQNPHPEFARTAAAIRQRFAGPLVLNGGFDREGAEAALTGGRADLIAFGRPFIANPDLVDRLRTGAALAVPDPQTFYTPEARGYIDYPALA